MRRRISLLLLAVSSLVLSACSSATEPKRDGWLPDGTYCSGYISSAGECVDGH